MPKNKITFSETKLWELKEFFKNLSNIDLDEKKARLFPKGNSINENQTTSIFLASLSAVKEYREELISFLGSNKINAFNAQLHTFTQLNSEDNKSIPDGLIVITTGKHEPVVEWACIVEAKIDKNPIEKNQIMRYIKFAKSIGIDRLLTISNDLATSPNQSPVVEMFSKRELGKFKLYHWSWMYLKVTASRLIRNDAINDEDHVFILRELRHFFNVHPKVKNFNNMGSKWREYSEQVGESRRKAVSNKTSEIIAKSFVQEEKDLALQLTDKKRLNLHIESIPIKNRLNHMKEQICKDKQVVSTYMVNSNKHHTFEVVSNFIEREIKCSTKVIIQKGKAKAQTTSLLKMLSKSAVPNKIFITAVYKYNRESEKHSLQELEKQLENPLKTDYSILDKTKGDTVKHFEITTSEKIGASFYSQTKFIKKLEANATQFLEQVVCNLKL